MDNNLKFDSFIELAGALNSAFGTLPILYGSLGLSRAIGIKLDTDDVDILLESSVFKSKIDAVHSLMESLDFSLVDIDENKFRRGSLEVGIASDGDMESFCGVDPLKLDVIRDPVSYRVLNAEQFLAVYKAASLDGYRKDKRLKDDDGKIRLIESVLFA